MEETIGDQAVGKPSALERFHLGISSDGTSCLLLFIDEDRHAISCVANFAEFNAFIASLMQAAAEMTRRRTLQSSDDDVDFVPGENAMGENAIGENPVQAMTVASAAFHMSPHGECMLGSLIGDGGEVVGIRLPPSVANEMTKAMLMASPAASAC
jgi:hypothetical protein